MTVRVGTVVRVLEISSSVIERLSEHEQSQSQVQSILPSLAMPSTPPTLSSTVTRLRTLVDSRTPCEGRTDSLHPGLRYYRFSAPIEYHKTQRLMPGVVVVLQGRKIATLQGRKHTYDAMHHLVLGREALCQGTVVSASAEAPYLAIHLDLPPAVMVKTLVALAEVSPATSGPPSPPRSDVETAFVSPVDPTVLEALVRLLPATDTTTDRATIAPLIVEEIVVRLLRSHGARALLDAAALTRSAARIQQSVQFIQANFRRPLSVNELADRVAMSPSHFAHCFRQVAGVSPMRYLRDVRLDAACARLLGGSVRSGELAAEIGFESAAHFNREFKRRFDVSPTEYVRRLCGGARDQVRSSGQ